MTQGITTMQGLTIGIESVERHCHYCMPDPWSLQALEKYPDSLVLYTDEAKRILQAILVDR